MTNQRIQPDVDGLETQMLWNRLHATADEMYETAKRLAFSLLFEVGATFPQQ